MRFSTIILTGLSLVGNTIGVPIQMPNNNTIFSNFSNQGDDDVLGGFHLLHPENITSMATTTGQYNRDEQVPFRDLSKTASTQTVVTAGRASEMLGSSRFTSGAIRNGFRHRIGCMSIFSFVSKTRVEAVGQAVVTNRPNGKRLCVQSKPRLIRNTDEFYGGVETDLGLMGSWEWMLILDGGSNLQ
ncbi:hypothetical protein F4804DRAFT_317936 [Jackrogersella minutella]|nr:hypothetical protein F4804DRAFT_317936 [Jackrogersella minutella]